MNSAKIFLKIKKIIIRIVLALFFILIFKSMYYFQTLDLSSLTAPDELKLFRMEDSQDQLDDWPESPYKTVASKKDIKDLYSALKDSKLRRAFLGKIEHPLYFFTTNLDGSFIIICFNNDGEILIYDLLKSSKKYKGRISPDVVKNIISN